MACVVFRAQPYEGDLVVCVKDSREEQSTILFFIFITGLAKQC